MVRKKIDLSNASVVIRDEERKKFSIHFGLMEDAITNEVVRLQEKGRNIFCFVSSLPEGKVVLHFEQEGYKQVEDARVL